MERLLAAHPSCKGAFHDTPSPTHDRGYAGAQSFPAYPDVLRATGFPLCTPLPQVTRSPGSGEHSVLPSLPDQPKETGSWFYPHRGGRPAFPLQGNAPQRLEFGRRHPRTQETAETTHRSQSRRGPAFSRLCTQSEAPHDPDDLLRCWVASL